MSNCLNYVDQADISSRGGPGWVQGQWRSHFKGSVPLPSLSGPKTAFVGSHTGWPGSLGPQFPFLAWEPGHGAIASQGS